MDGPGLLCSGTSVEACFFKTPQWHFRIVNSLLGQQGGFGKEACRAGLSTWQRPWAACCPWEVKAGSALSSLSIPLTTGLKVSWAGLLVVATCGPPIQVFFLETAVALHTARRWSPSLQRTRH